MQFLGNVAFFYKQTEKFTIEIKQYWLAIANWPIVCWIPRDGAVGWEATGSILFVIVELIYMTQENNVPNIPLNKLKLNNQVKLSYIQLNFKSIILFF